MSFFARVKERLQESITYLDASPSSTQSHISLQAELAQCKNERLELLRELKASIGAVVQSAFAAGDAADEPRLLDDEDELVRQLLIWLERSLWHGMKKENKKLLSQPKGTALTLWTLLSHLLFLPRDAIDPAVASTLERVHRSQGFRSSVGKSRAWMRLALNDKVLDKGLCLVAKRRKLMTLYYEDYALLRDEEAATTFFAIILALNGLDFAFKWENPALDKYQEPIRRPALVDVKEKSLSSAMQSMLQPSAPAIRSPLKPRKSLSNAPTKNWVSAGLEMAGKENNGRRESRAGSVQPKLEDLVTSLETCITARLEWRIGVPDLVARLVALLWVADYAQAEALFSSDATVSALPGQVVHLVKALEDLGGGDLHILQRVGVDVEQDIASTSVHASTVAALGNEHLLNDAVTLAAILKTALLQMQRPLIPQDSSPAFHACLELEDEKERVRNLGCLFEALPEVLKPTLCLLLSLFHRLVHLNGDGEKITAEVIARRLAMVLLGRNDDQEERVVSVKVLTVLIENTPELIKRTREQIVAAKQGLADKLARLRERSTQLSTPLDSNDTIVLEQLRFLWEELRPAEDFGDDFQLVSKGWRRRGFQSENAVEEFRGGGRTALEDICYFVSKHRVKARQMAHSCNEPSTFKYPFVQTAVQMTRMTTSLLGLSGHEFADLGEADERNALGQQPWWHMLNAKDAATRVFCMTFLLFDINFTEAKASMKSFFAMKQETKQQMSLLINQGPVTVDELWHSWIQMRAQHNKIGSVSPPKPSKPPAQPQAKSGEPEPVSPPRIADGEETDEREGTLSNASSDEEADEAAENNSRGSRVESEVNPELVQYLPNLRGESQVLNQSIIAKLEASLPDNYQGYDWSLVYGSVRNGENLELLYQLCANHQATLLVVKDVEGTVFGGFNTTCWKIESQYYGTGESFLFTFKDGFKVYRWSKKNKYFMLASDDSLGMGGGGDGGFGLFLDGDLKAGTSASCETYDSECLASGEDFQCAFVEVWTFQLKSS